MAEEYDGETTFSPTNSSKEHLNSVNSTKLLLNASKGHQAPRKAAHCLRKEVGKNVKVKREAKEVEMEICPGKGALKKREVSKHQKTLSLMSPWQALKPQRAT